MAVIILCELVGIIHSTDKIHVVVNGVQLAAKEEALGNFNRDKIAEVIDKGHAITHRRREVIFRGLAERMKEIPRFHDVHRIHSNGSNQREARSASIRL
jgi:hypothetical protein